MKKKLNVAILGTGNIGTDLLYKVYKSDYLICSMFVGRRADSPGIQAAKKLNINTHIEGVQALLDNANNFDLIFDATSAEEHLKNFSLLLPLNKYIINLTPAKKGQYCVPSVNGDIVSYEKNFNMVTCGGQVSIPLIMAIYNNCQSIEYLEVVTTLSSESAGKATRRNLDHYIATTENAITEFSKCTKVKSMIILNPAIPSIPMTTTIYADVNNLDMKQLAQETKIVSKTIEKYGSSYKLILEPSNDGGRIMMTVMVTGSGDYLPAAAGNLDIIDCAAVDIAERIYERQKGTYLIC